MKRRKTMRGGGGNDTVWTPVNPTVSRGYQAEVRARMEARKEREAAAKAKAIAEAAATEMERVREAQLHAPK